MVFGWTPSSAAAWATLIKAWGSLARSRPLDAKLLLPVVEAPRSKFRWSFCVGTVHRMLEVATAGHDGSVRTAWPGTTPLPRSAQQPGHEHAEQAAGEEDGAARERAHGDHQQAPARAAQHTHCTSSSSDEMR